ncbi:DIP1984 family protein [Lederbergia sp. NSJ-179]|uniref:DIP1984 family protein n=1 Tax=Lederbergia sp. NSJ-179 TaxID=2931402 RepID=UPI001FD1CC05|nr:DIP1984 family protein [Lederbergia sp. NSJ-179]MCJ7840467.1 DIP1984 family protein [Lederbergia sp. NSJ-179]
MAKINLAEAVKLKSILTKRIHELEEEIRRVAFVTIEKGEEIGPISRSLFDVEKELDEIRADTRLLDKLMYRANIDHTIPYQEKELTLVEAIELATQLRAKARMYKELGSAQKEEIQYGYADNTTVYQVALFEPEEYRIQALQLEKQAHKLSNLINAKNYSITLEFDDDKYF